MTAQESTPGIRTELIERIRTMPESQLGTVRRFLRFLREDDDPFVHRHLDAPIDSERSSSSEDHAAALAREEFDRGEYVPLEELEAEFGRD